MQLLRNRLTFRNEYQTHIYNSLSFEINSEQIKGLNLSFIDDVDDICKYD